MDDIEEKLTSIITRIESSQILETDKADILAEMAVGMRRLVWPILLSHVPEYILKDATAKKSQFTLTDYTELITTSLQNPATPKELHDELLGALREVDTLLTERLPKPVPAPHP